MSMSLKWERVAGSTPWGSGIGVLRAKVPGGWLVRAEETGGSRDGICFYPDPEHEWTIEEDE